ncbi:MAG: ABC transporter ATP-binding protein, partial [Solirubrobacteraceae bacterium]
LTVHAGELVTLLGPSGCGKTTTLRLVAGLEDADGGTISVGGRDITRLPASKRDMGMVFQAYSLFPHMTVRQNVAFGLRLRGVDAAARDKRAMDMLELVQLGSQAGRYPHQISGGQQQRVALARALAIKPEVVLLDEPFASLDANLRASVREDVASILRESATTTLLVTHDQDEALSLADLVAVLRGGTIAQYATPQDLYARPLDDQLARFIGEANLFEGTIEGTLVDTPLGKLTAHWHGAPPRMSCPATVLVRPEQIQLHPAHGTTGLTGTIVGSGYHGHDAVLRVKLGQEHNDQSLIVRTQGGNELPLGSDVILTVRGPVLVWPAGSTPAVSAPPASARAEI